MHAIRHIVVGLDFTPSSWAALRQAARIATWNHAGLHVIHVMQSSWVHDLASLIGVDGAEFSQELEDRTRRAAQDVALQGDLGVQASVDVMVGSPLEVLTRVVRADGAGLLVLGVRSPTSQGRGAGPVAAACLRRTPSSVLLARDDHVGAFTSIVACVDFSPTSFRAVEAAVRVALQDKSRLRIIHVAIPPGLDLAFAAHPLGVWPGQPLKAMEMWNTYRTSLEPRLEAFVAPLRANMKDLDVALEICENEHYGRGIHAYALEHRADLLVLGTQGATNLRYALLGSTAERVLADLPCSALAVKPANVSISAD